MRESQPLGVRFLKSKMCDLCDFWKLPRKIDSVCSKQKIFDSQAGPNMFMYVLGLPSCNFMFKQLYRSNFLTKQTKHSWPHGEGEGTPSCSRKTDPRITHCNWQTFGCKKEEYYHPLWKLWYLLRLNLILHAVTELFSSPSGRTKAAHLCKHPIKVCDFWPKLATLCDKMCEFWPFLGDFRQKKSDHPGKYVIARVARFCDLSTNVRFLIEVGDMDLLATLMLAGYVLDAYRMTAGFFSGY